MNNVNISGRLIKDPELKTLENNKFICTFFIANDVHYGGNKKTGFFKCTAFGKTAKTISDHVRVGRELFIGGRLDQYRYEDKTGKTNFNVSIVVDSFDFGAKPNSASNDSVQQAA